MVSTWPTFNLRLYNNVALKFSQSLLWLEELRTNLQCLLTSAGTNQDRFPIRRTAARPISEGMIHRQTMVYLWCKQNRRFLDDFFFVV